MIMPKLAKYDIERRTAFGNVAIFSENLKTWKKLKKNFNYIFKM